MILCDTNILIEFYKGNPQIVESLRKVGPSNLAISVITAGELFYGAKDKRELNKIRKHHFLLEQISPDEDVSANSYLC
jgi:tRNA(fMet)-specific endonuclease VapC